MSLVKLTASTIAIAAASATAASARDDLWIVGSSTVLPYGQAEAQEHAIKPGASRANTHDRGMTLDEMYQALGAQVEVTGAWVDNPFKKGSEINPQFPDIDIVVIGPPPTPGPRGAWVGFVMHGGGKQRVDVKTGGFDREWVNEKCSCMRVDGPFIEAGENDNRIVQKLLANPNAIGIFGHSVVDENLDRLKGIKHDGGEPKLETIADFIFPVARPHFFDIENTHRGAIPNLHKMSVAYILNDALAPGGYLTERGLVPPPEARRAKMQAEVIAGEAMALSSS